MNAVAMARTAGLFYLGTTLGGLFAELVARSGAIVSGDASATAQKILATEGVYRWGIAADLFASACYLVVTYLLYELLKPVNPRISAIAAVFSAIGIAIGSAALVLHIAPLVLLGNASYLSAFTADQLQSMAYLALKFHGQAYDIALVFFGVYCCLVGYLVFFSTYLPRAIGVLMALAGVVYLVNSFTVFVTPPIADAIPDAVGFISLLGEAALTFWLIAFGVDQRGWNAALASRR